MTISSAVSKQYTNVTDGRTDGHCPTASTALLSVASRGKITAVFFLFTKFKDVREKMHCFSANGNALKQLGVFCSSAMRCDAVIAVSHETER